MNYEQIALKRRIEMCLFRNQKGFFGVFGPGGTGKTYTVTRIAGASKFLFLAPTNKASKIVSKNLKDAGINKRCLTIDKYLGYKKEKDEFDEDVIKYTPIEKLDIPEVIVVDEVSMVNDGHHKIFNELGKKTFIVLIGDKKQIPPVEEEEKKNFDSEGFECSRIFNDIDESFSLTIQNRQSEKSQLYKMISFFRSIMSQKIDFKDFITRYINNKDVFYYDFNSKEFEEYVRDNQVTAVCYKNMTANFFCYKISKIRNPKDNFKEISIGKIFYFTTSCITNEKTFYTSETIEIIDIDVVEKEIQMPVLDKKWKYEYRQLTVKCLETNELHKIYLPNENARSAIYSYKKRNIESHLLTGDQKAKINTWYQRYLNAFAKLSPTVAITAHKSQGSTYKNVIVPIFDFADYRHKFKYFNQLFYTAISRASKNIVFVHGKNNFDDTSIRVSQWTEEEKKFILELNDYQCHVCNKIFDSDRDFDIHHIKPLNQGGTNNPKNLAPICKPCHKKTHSK